MEQPKFNSVEDIDAKLEQKILFAKEHAVPSEFLNKNPFSEEDMDMVRKARISCGSLYELNTALQLLGIKSEDVLDTVAHENAHANKAESMGANHHDYRILVSKINGEYAYRVSAGIELPDEWEMDKKKEGLIAILKAPEEYGNELSPSDISLLNKLED